jgi:hypothetical protein
MVVPSAVAPQTYLKTGVFAVATEEVSFEVALRYGVSVRNWPWTSAGKDPSLDTLTLMSPEASVVIVST